MTFRKYIAPSQEEWNRMVDALQHKDELIDQLTQALVDAGLWDKFVREVLRD